MSLNIIHQAIVDTFKAGIPSLRTCDRHGGRFNERELRRHASASPTLLVAAVSFGDLKGNPGESLAEISWVCFVIAKDAPKQPRGIGAATLAEAAAKLIKGNRWGIDEAVGKPTRINSRNLYGSNLDSLGVAMWGISWRQLMDLGSDIDLDALEDFLEFHQDIDIDPTQDGEPLASDTVTLQE